MGREFTVTCRKCKGEIPCVEYDHYDGTGVMERPHDCRKTPEWENLREAWRAYVKEHKPESASYTVNAIIHSLETP